MSLAEPPLRSTMAPRGFRVTNRVQETVDTYTLVLEPTAADRPSIRPGQFMMVYAFGVGEVPISVSGSDRGAVVLTVRAVGAVSAKICDAARGTVLGLRGPFGNGWPLDAATGADVVVVAGGIGLAPLRPLVRHVCGHRGDFATATVLYGARTPADLLYVEEFDSWRESIDVAVTVDSGNATWSGQVGVVPKLVGAARFDPATAHAFVCGPEVMMDFTIEALLGRGVAAERIHLSMERHMACGVGLCGHCQLGPTLICRDGPIYSHARVAALLGVREL